MTEELKTKVALLEQQREHDKQIANDNHAQVMECLQSNKTTMQKMSDTIAELGEFRHEVMGIGDRLSEIHIKQNDDSKRIDALEKYNVSNKSFFENMKVINRWVIGFLCAAVIGGGLSTFYESKNKTENTDKVAEALNANTQVIKKLLEGK